MARRVAIAVSCRDTDVIPKVDGAGEVFEREGQRLQRMHNGVLIVEGCYHGPWMTEVIRCLRGHHEPQEEFVFHELMERIASTEARPTMIELGSWWAYYSLWFAAAARDAAVVAVEPDPVYLDVGRQNFRLNGLDATFLAGAIGETPGELVAFRSGRTSATMTVPCHDLRSLLETTRVETVSMLLVDIQGAEATLLDRGQRELESGRVRFLVLSTHHHRISGSPLTHQDARELLRSLGAHIVAEHTVGESFSGDGLIAAAFHPEDRDLRVDVSRSRYCESLFGELEYDLAESWDPERRAYATLSWKVTQPLRAARRLQLTHLASRRGRRKSGDDRDTS